MEPQADLSDSSGVENLWIKPRKRLNREKPEPLAVPEEINQVWSKDFMHDVLYYGKLFKLNIIDESNYEIVGTEIDTGSPAARVIRTPGQLGEIFGPPQAIRLDNGR